jgi:ATP-dependent helicase/nuclease subunit A
MSQQPAFPHVVIRASAGTGKTYQLAVRFIGLLAAGARPDEILATTFMRKAAGEILDRVLYWLAIAAADDQERRKLAEAIGLKDFSAEACRNLLLKTLRRLHALRVGTLDSYFLQVATSFGQELGLPPGWSICDETVDAVLRDEAIELVLGRGKLSELLTLVHALTKGAAARSVARLARDTVTSLFELYREAAADAWTQISVGKGLEPHELEAALVAVEALTVAEKRMITARGEDLARFRGSQWDEFLDKGLAVKILNGQHEFYRKPLPQDLIAAYQPLLKHVESILVGQVARQTAATHDLLEQFAEHYRELQLDERAMRFSDVTMRLAEAAQIVGPERLAFRLDGGIRHVLLDEFQDTSPTQWRVLRPLAKHVTSAAGGSFFCVGDAKQAIYGWRGGVAAIFDAISAELKGLKDTKLAESFRSSQPVIDAANAVFQNLTQHPNLDKLTQSVQAWQAAFPKHSTRRTELAGHVTLATSPAATEEQSQSDVLLEYAAEQIRECVLAAPQATVGVLVRTNTAVARLIYLLRQAGIPASEEGGNPLVDSPAVELILSLLKLADHPADSVACFHLASSPLAPSIVEFANRHGMPLASHFDHADPTAAAGISLALRRELLEAGYGATIFAWAKRLAASCDRRELSRLQQLVEMAYEYQPASTLRTADFIRLVQSRRVADPQAVGVRVMTIHQSKGLEFDVVFLPELEGKLVGQPDRFVAGRPSPTEPVNIVCRLANENVRQFFPPKLQQLFENDLQIEVQESLCVLYVAMTRAVHGLHMIIAPAKSNEKILPKTFAGLLRATLAANRPATPETLLYEHGAKVAVTLPLPSLPSDDGPRSAPTPQIQLAAASTSRERGLERKSPSSLEGGARIAAGSILAPRSSHGFGIGTLFHAWLEQIEWLDAGLPSEQRLRQIASQVRGQIGEAFGDLDAHLQRFHQQIAAADITQLLSRQFYDSPAALGLSQKAWPAGGVELSASRERPFAIRHGDELLNGSIDRLVVIKSGGRPLAADVIDFKTDEIAPGDQASLAAKIDFYRPQIEAYRSAAARLLSIEPSHICARLVFLHLGSVVSL